jgi:hypothetical protein
MTAAPNKARFRIVGNTTSPSSNRGYYAVAGESLAFQLEDTTGVGNATWETYDPASPSSPLASLNAPVFNFGNSHPAYTNLISPYSASAVAPSSSSPVSNSWFVRCTVSTDTGPQVFTRCVNITGGKGRKPIPGESVENSARGWADDVSYLVENNSAGGGTGGALPIVTVITSNVANLAAGPTTNDGITLQPGDIVGLGGQTNPAQIGLYQFGTGGTYTLQSAPADGTLLTATKGVVYKNTLYIFYAATSITAALSTTGVYQGAWTAANVAPDIRGVPLIDQPPGPQLALTADGNYHTIASFDFVARGQTSGRLVFVGMVWSIDSTHDALATMRCPFKCSATPTAGAPPVSYPIDMIDDGSGPYYDVRWFVVGTSLCLQVKSLESGTKTYVGVLSCAVGAVQ